MGGAVAVTTLAAVAALAWGSHPIPLATVLDAFTAYDPTNPSHVVVTQSRVPRAILGVLVGADGRIPRSTWLVIGLLTASGIAVGIYLKTGA